MLYSLIYISKAAQLFTDEHLTGLLLQAQPFNQAAHLTGMLIYVYAQTGGQPEGRFMQALEGEKNEVLALYERIRADSRHYDVMTMDEGPVRQRVFRSWAMGFKAMDARKTADLPDYLNLADYHTIDKHLSGISKPVNYLKSFYQINRELKY